MSLLALHMSSLERCLFKSFTDFCLTFSPLPNLQALMKAIQSLIIRAQMSSKEPDGELCSYHPPSSFLFPAISDPNYFPCPFPPPLTKQGPSCSSANDNKSLGWEEGLKETLVGILCIINIQMQKPTAHVPCSIPAGLC